MIQKQTCQWNKMRRWLNSVETLGNNYMMNKAQIPIKQAQKQMRKYDGIKHDASIQVLANFSLAMAGEDVITEDTLIDIWTLVIYE